MSNNMTFSVLSRFFVHFCCSPVTIFFSALLGVLCGICFPTFSQGLSTGGTVYLKYITLLMIPLMICALSASLAALIQQNRREQSGISLKKMFALMICMSMLSGLLGIFSEIAVNYFFPNQINVEQLDELLHAKENTQADYSIRMFEAPKENIQKQFSFHEFVLEYFPTNIFESLNKGDTLHILIFSLLFGFALGMIPAAHSQNVIKWLSSIYQVCIFLIQCSVYVLPFCLFCLLANMISLLDYSALKLVSQFMLVILVLEIFLIVLGLILWARTLRMPVSSLLKTEGRTMLIAFSSCQSFVVMPMLMQDMEEKMHYSSAQLKLVVPFAFTMGKYTRTLLMSVTVVFISYLYYGSFAWSMIPMLLIIAPLLAISGGAPIVIAPLLKILGMPGELGLLLLITISPFVEPLATLCNVIYNALFSSLVMEKPKPVTTSESLRPF